MPSPPLSPQQKFIVSLYPAARRISEETGMSWELILAQAALETGWGQKVLPETNNIFNIKASRGWQGPTKVFRVWEIEDGRKVWRDDPFRVYDSVDDALRDRIRFLQENPRYARAGLFEPGTKGDLVKEAEALQRAGYATDPTYALQLKAVFDGRTMQTSIVHASAQSPSTQSPQRTGAHPVPADADGMLKPGERGPEIVRLQQRLNALGREITGATPVPESGTYDQLTLVAVTAFQKSQGLSGSGTVGPLTLQALERVERTQAKVAAERVGTHAPSGTATAAQAVYIEAYRHFLADGNRFEYGRGDMRLKNIEGNGTTDSSRTEGDGDRDGLKGVDCSSFVWRGLKNAGYGVGPQPFTTHALFSGSSVTAFASRHFDVIPASEARRPNGLLQQGDIILFKDKDSAGQHVGIFKEYDNRGGIRFIGSQVAEGPAEASAAPGTYWNGRAFDIVGALRAKPEFQIRPPLHGQHQSTQAMPSPAPATPPRARAPDSISPPLSRGDTGPAVGRLQERLVRLGYEGADGKPLRVDNAFGEHTLAAVRRFQLDHGLEGKGMVGPKTLAALDAAERGLVTHPSHPHHALYERVLERLQQAEAAKGLRSGPHSERIAAAVAVECLREGVQRIDRVEFNTDNTLVRAVQIGAVRDEPGLNRSTDPISTRQAGYQSIAESSEQIHQVAVNLQAQQRDQQHQARTAPAH